ncbi:MAG: glycosyltransferase [Myxococcota bacterium]
MGPIETALGLALLSSFRGGTVFAPHAPMDLKPAVITTPSTSLAYALHHARRKSRTLRIVDVSEFYALRGGGVKRYTDQKLEAAERHGVHLTVIAPGPETRREARPGGAVQWVAGPPMPLDPRYYVLHRRALVHRHIRRCAPDVIEGSSVWSAGWFAATYPGKAKRALVYHQDPVAVYPHTLFDRFLSRERLDGLCMPYWSYLRRLSKRFDATVVAGDWLGERLKRHRIERTLSVPFGAPQRTRIPGADARAHWLAKTGAGERGELLIAISRHHPEKRLGTVFRAFEMLRARRSRPLGLVLFGDGPMRRFVERVAPKGVHVAGYTNSMEELDAALEAGDAFLHGGAAETYGLVVAEALAAGLPVVVPNVGGAADLAEPTYAEVYEPGDAADCARAVERLLARDPQTLRAAARAKRLRTLDEHFADLFARYDALIERGDLRSARV